VTESSVTEKFANEANAFYGQLPLLAFS